MHRIDGAGHVNNLFVNEDPATNRPPTEITAEWLNANQEELAGFIEYMQIALVKGDNTQLRQALLKAFPLKDGATGLIRTLTPAGGARVRELGDIPNAATVGGIEYGFCYNCNIDLVTGVWAGRDVADICWLEKWTDVGGVKELWYAPTAAAGAAPAWALAGKIDLVNGIPQFNNSKQLATTEFVQRAIGSLSGFTTINANIALTAAHAGRGCYFSAAAIASLPPANSVPAGTLIYFASFTTGATSVAREGTDTIAASSASSALTSMALLDGEDLLLESNGNNQWIAVGGSARLNYSGGRLGVGQVWASYAGARALGTVYTNTSGKPIVISATCTINSAGMLLYATIAGVVAAWSSATYAVNAQVGVTAVVPPGATYAISASGGTPAGLSWAELR